MSRYDDEERVRRAAAAYERQPRRLGPDQKVIELGAAATAAAEGNVRIVDFGEQLGQARDAALARLEAQDFHGVEMLGVLKEIGLGFLKRRKQTVVRQIPGWKFADYEDIQSNHIAYYLLADRSFFAIESNVDFEMGTTYIDHRFETEADLSVFSFSRGLQAQELIDSLHQLANVSSES